MPVPVAVGPGNSAPRRPGRRATGAAIGVCAGLLLAAATVRSNGFTLLEWWRDLHSGIVVSRAAGSAGVVALTFDDGPDPRYTPRVLDILRRSGVHATFFEEGRMIDARPDLALRVVAEGHVVGNHTYTHPYITRLSAGEQRREIGRCDTAIRSRLNIETELFRPPRGDWNPGLYREAIRARKRIVLWSVALEHQALVTPAAMADQVLERVRPGDIVLMHDGGSAPRETTVLALPLVLEGLRRRGLRCVTVPELLHLRGPVAAAAGRVEAAPGRFGNRKRTAFVE